MSFMRNMSSEDVEIGAAKADLLQRCRDTWDELQQIQSQLSLAEPQTVASLTQSQLLTAGLQEKQRMLTAEIEQLTEDSNSTDDILPGKPPVIRELLLEDLRNDVEQLQQTLTLVRLQRTQTKQCIDSETGKQSNFEQLRISLEDNGKTANSENIQPQISATTALELAKARRSKLRQLYKARLEQMVAFVEKYFPPLTEEDIKKWQKMTFKSRAASGASSFLPLSTILENLMNRAIEVPNDAYIVADDSFWPPYVEMLLRCGIVLRHPSDDQRIRLTPHHY